MTLKLKRQARQIARRLGVDVVRYPAADPLWRLATMLRHRQTRTILDVGANDGGYGSTVRSLGYHGQIVSFEPLSSAYSALSRRAGGDPSWSAYNFALGARDESRDINIAGNDGASSSLLPMLERHTRAAPSSQYTGVEKILIKRIDGLSHELDGVVRPVLLKLDVQGYEGSVLDGGREFVRSSVDAIQMELSLVPLYEGSIGWMEGVSLVESLGFRVAGMNPGFWDQTTGELLQFDALFVRDAK